MTPRRRAFTLIETITTMTIVVVIIAITSPIVVTAVDGYATTATRAEISAAASAALERITTEMRNIPLQSSTSTAKPAIDSMTTNSITWSTNNSMSLSGTTLQLVNAGATARTLVSNVQSFSISAYDESNNALASSLSGSQCDAIRRLSITLAVSRGGVTETMRTRVFLRCMTAGASP